MNENNTNRNENQTSRMPFMCPCMYNTYMTGAYPQNGCPFMYCPFMSGGFQGGTMPQYNMFGQRANIPFPESQE